MADYNVITDTNWSDLSPTPTLSDDVYVSRGAHLTIDEDAYCNRIRLGEESTGASPAGQRYGILTGDGNAHTVTFAGNATNTNSGLWMNPASADSSSKGCKLQPDGLTFTNDGDALDSNKRWCLYLVYGYIDNSGGSWTIKNTYGYGILCRTSSTYVSVSETNWGDLTFVNHRNAIAFQPFSQNAAIDVDP